MSLSANKVYTVTVKLKDGNWVKYRAVNGMLGIKRLVNYFDTHFLGDTKWLFCNVYEKDSKQQVANYLNGNNPTRP